MRPVMSYGQKNNFISSIPFQGRGDFGFVASQSNFTPGITIKLLPLADLSLPQEVETSEFDQLINDLNDQFRPGKRLSGVEVNTQHQKGGSHKVFGRFIGFQLDRKNQVIRAFIRDSASNKKVEVYPASLMTVNEASSHHTKTFMQFLIQD
jgi:hypothetical protein